MAEPENSQEEGVKTEASAAPEATGVNPNEVPAAGEQEAAAQTPEGQEQPQTVPYERFQEAIAEKNQLQGQVQNLQQQAMAMGQGQVAQAQPQAQPADPLEGVEDFEQVTAGQLRQVAQQTTGHVNRMIAEQQFLTSHPDYNEVVGARDNTTGFFMPAAPMLEALSKNPLLANLIQNSPTPMLTAYTFAKQQREQSAAAAQVNTPEQQAAAQAAQMSPAAAEALARRDTPGSASQVGSAGGFNKANQIATMTDKEFAEHKEKVKEKG